MKHLKKIGTNVNRSENFCIKRSVIIIGRDIQQADLILENNASKSYISRIHARIIYTNNIYKIFDDSRNGIFINNIKILNEAVLNEGDLITFGHPIGEKILPGERVRQPNSEFQFVFESCNCEHSKNPTTNVNITTTAQSFLDTVPNSDYDVLKTIESCNNMVIEKVCTNLCMEVEAVCCEVIPIDPKTEEYSLKHNEVIFKLNKKNDDIKINENKVIISANDVALDTKNIENDINIESPTPERTDKFLAQNNNLESHLQALHDFSLNVSVEEKSTDFQINANENINDVLTHKGSEYTLSIHRDSIIDSIIKLMLENVVLDKDFMKYNLKDDSNESNYLITYSEDLTSGKRKFEEISHPKKKIKLDNSNMCMEHLTYTKESSSNYINDSPNTNTDILSYENDNIKNNTQENKVLLFENIESHRSNEVNLINYPQLPQGTDRLILDENISVQTIPVSYDNNVNLITKEIQNIKPDNFKQENIESNLNNTEVDRVSPTDLFFNPLDTNIERRTPRSKKSMAGNIRNLLEF